MFHHQIRENTGTSAASADWRGIGKRSAKDRQPNVALCGFSFVDFPLRIFLCVFFFAYFPLRIFLCVFSFAYFPLRIFLGVFSLAYFPWRIFLGKFFLADFPWWRLPSFRNKQA